jgi:hypothetical protein
MKKTNLLMMAVLLVAIFSVAFITHKKDKMFKHVVCFKFKEGISEEAKQKHIQYFASLKDSIPEIVAYEAGPAEKVP